MCCGWAFEGHRAIHWLSWAQSWAKDLFSCGIIRIELSQVRGQGEREGQEEEEVFLPKYDLNKISVGILYLIKIVVKSSCSQKFQKKTYLNYLTVSRHISQTVWFVFVRVNGWKRGDRLLPLQNLNRWSMFPQMRNNSIRTLLTMLQWPLIFKEYFNWWLLCY